MFYRPDNKSVCADVIPYFKDGEFKLFYLKDYRDLEKVGEGCDWNFLTTKDLVNFTDHGIAIKRGGLNDQDLYVYTGSVFEWNGIYYIFYTGHNPHFAAQNKPVQAIMLATSKDLKTWEKQSDFIFTPNTSFLENNDFRDPFVFRDEEKGEFVMILTSRLKNDEPNEHKGLLLKATSKDLKNWKLEKKPFYSPHAFYAHECPDIFKMGDWYYLIFSEFSDRFVTTYRMAKSLNGPWINPKTNTFDGHAFYAAKSVSDGKRRILFGWNPIKNNEDDNDFWQWGGSIVCHEIYQNKDGTLSVRCPKEVLNSFNKKTSLCLDSVYRDCKLFGNSISFDNENRNIVKVGKLNENTRIEFDVIPKNESGDFGVYLYEKNNFEEYYKLRFDREYNRIIMDIWPRVDRMVHSQIDVERKCELALNKKNHVTILVEGSVLEVYVNNKVALSFRMFKIGGDLDFYSHGTLCEFKNIEVYEK